MAKIKTMGKASTTAKQKVISTSTPSGVKGGKGKMFGKQTVKASPKA